MICTKLMPTRYVGLLALLFWLGCLPFSRISAQEICSTEMSRKAVSLLLDARDGWPSLLKHQKTFVSCDDGELGEGYSDAVVHLFAEKWGQFGIFVDLAKKHPDFQRWAIRHIDATASDEDLRKIIANAASCIDADKARKLCRSVREAAKNALMESVQNQ